MPFPQFSSLLLFLSMIFCLVVSELLVKLPNGLIQGYTRKSPNNVAFNAFQGIPYAKPPLGKLRFQPPVPADNWEGILQTKKDGSRCYSVKKDTKDENEDCLFINVYTPVLKIENATLLPVMVYFYGGGFRDGASQYNVYGPDYLIEHDVVMVSMNYRVGPFGFLTTGDNVIPGNVGLKDQVLALKWIQKNIGLFGGDNTKVTIFGQSAGAASVGFHIVSKQSSGLFRAGIAESGSALSNWGYLADPKPYGYELASKINSTKNFETNEDLLEFLQSVPAKVIDIASTKTTNIDHPLPVIEVEHEGAFLTKSMYSMLENGEINKVSLLMGVNSEEQIHLAEDMDSLYTTAENCNKRLSKLIPENMNLKNKTDADIVGKKIKEIYMKSDSNMQDNLGLTIAYKSESRFYNPCIRHAQLQSKYTDVYFYQFSYAGVLGANTNISLPGAEKCTHGEELYYIFKRKMNSYDNTDLSIFSEADVLTQKRMVKIWTNFAKYMNPTPTKDPLLQNISWPKMDTDETPFVNIANDLSIQSEVKNGRYLKWIQIFEEYAKHPLIVF
nr:venom carboxylesterase-6-like [Leptinotarsa decemlineata]